MNTGSTYRLTTSIPALANDNEERIVTVRIPGGATLRIVDPNAPMVKAVWESRTVLVFAIDVREAGELVCATGVL